MKRMILVGLAFAAMQLGAQVNGFVPLEPWQAARADVNYDHATSLLDRGKYEEAAAEFDRVQTGGKADGALYWKAYCLNKLGRRDQALTALAKLRQGHPKSRWIDDAKMLEAEARQNSGEPGAGDASNDELKLMAVNSALMSDPERGLPVIERLLKSNNSPRLKDRALFVLTQSSSPRAKQLLTEIAKGGSNPDLQMKAIRYIGMTGSNDATRQLLEIYNSSSDVDVKKNIIRSLMMASAKDKILDLSRTEKHTELRKEAIRNLGMMGGATELKAMYAAEQDASVKKEIVNGLFMTGDAKGMVELARKERDQEMKKNLVSKMSMMGGKEVSDYMMEILK